MLAFWDRYDIDKFNKNDLRGNMTNSEIIEEILFKSHSLHIVDEVNECIDEIIEADPNICRATAHQRAYDIILKSKLEE
tara:strand:- start:234 stop:470 length:237 start_codon:yes stop_codon:yes gene_type:complete